MSKKSKFVKQFQILKMVQLVNFQNCQKVKICQKWSRLSKIVKIVNNNIDIYIVTFE